MFVNILITFFCLTALTGGGIVLLHKDPTRCLFGLLLSVLSVGFLFLLLGGAFVAMVQLMVYAGAVLMLFLFVVRYFKQPSRSNRIFWQTPLAILIGFIVFFQILIPFVPYISEVVFDDWANPPGPGIIGENLYKKYLYPFELCSILLLVAIVGGIYMSQETDLKKEEDE